MHGLDLLALAAAGQEQQPPSPPPSAPRARSPPRAPPPPQQRTEPLPTIASFDSHYYPHHHDPYRHQEQLPQLEQQQLYNNNAAHLHAQSSSSSLDQPLIIQQPSSLIQESQLNQLSSSLIPNALSDFQQGPPLIQQQHNNPLTQQQHNPLIHQSSSPIHHKLAPYPPLQQSPLAIQHSHYATTQKILPQPSYLQPQSYSHLAPLTTFARPPTMPTKRTLSSGRSASRQGAGQHICRQPGCGKTFARAYGLRVHGRKHSDEQPYPCKDVNCGQRFKWRSSLRHHMRSRHKSM